MIQVKNSGAASAEVLIYEQIGQDWFGNGITADKFRADLAALGPVTDIAVRINSPGGAVFDGFAIHNALKQHPAQVHVHIDGIAASIASVIAMAGDMVTMGEGAMLMIHDPWTSAAGSAAQLRDAADVLDKVKVGIVEAYANRSGMDAASVSDLMAAETWLTADEAIANGFADQKYGAGAAISSNSQASLSRYRNVPMALLQPAAPVNLSATADALIEDSKMSTIEASVVTAESFKQAEKARQQEVRAMFAPFAQHRELFDSCISNLDCTPDMASKLLLAKLGEGAEPIAGPRIVAGTDARDKRIEGISNAIGARYGFDKFDARNEFNGVRLNTIIRDSLRGCGVTGVDRMENQTLAGKIFAAHSTSDFPLVLANTANKALRAAYTAAPLTWQQWAKQGVVDDFKANTRIQLGTFNSLATIAEGGEYTYGTFAEEQETITATTKGRGLMLTRQMVVNDDLGAFVDRARMLGFAAARTVNEDAYARLYASTAMADTGALFNATAVTTAGGHANYTSSGTAISVASIAVGETMIALQKDANLRTTLNIAPRFLLAPRGKRQIAWDVLNSPTEISQANPNKRNYAASLGLDLVVDAAMDANSTTVWFLLADPNVCPVIEVAFLGGNQTPYTDEMVDFETDAMKMKVRLDYGVQAIDWRGGYKNAGA